MDREKLDTLLKTPPAEVDFVALSEAVDDLEKTIRTEDAELQVRRANLDKLKNDRDALIGLRNFVAHFGSGPQPRVSMPQPSRRRGVKRDAILVVVSDGADWTPAQIRDRLVTEHIIDNDDAAYHALQVTLSTMARNGDLERPRKGVYRRPSATTSTTDGGGSFQT